MKTVFFGPFLGEFGWEMFHWHGWVRKMCREKYSSFRKIASSYPSREPFYESVDEFWGHPKEITNLNISQRNYIADNWFGNLPKAEGEADKNIGLAADKLLEDYRKKLPADTIFYVPHKLNSYSLNGKRGLFGTLWLRGLNIYKNPKVLSFQGEENQTFEILRPTEQGKNFLAGLVSPNQRLICVFPRRRLSRRPDKNWQKEKYDLLIERLKLKYPKHKIALCGAPNGAFYEEGVPDGCIDLINIPEHLRFNIQVAALSRADLALGSESGGIHAAMLVSCPTLEWGLKVNEKFVKSFNFLKTKLVYWPQVDPSVRAIEALADSMFADKEIDYPQTEESGQKDKIGPRIYLRELIARPFLSYIKRKKLKEGAINSLILK
jgi:hypothetical protein